MLPSGIHICVCVVQMLNGLVTPTADDATIDGYSNPPLRYSHFGLTRCVGLFLSCASSCDLFRFDSCVCAVQMLNGLVTPTKGDATIDGYSIRSDIQTIRTSLGVCQQQNTLWPTLTPTQHLRLFGKLRGIRYIYIYLRIEIYIYICIYIYMYICI